MAFRCADLTRFRAGLCIPASYKDRVPFGFDAANATSALLLQRENRFQMDTLLRPPYCGEWRGGDLQGKNKWLQQILSEDYL